jgi:hypothetical protein
MVLESLHVDARRVLLAEVLCELHLLMNRVGVLHVTAYKPDDDGGRNGNTIGGLRWRRNCGEGPARGQKAGKTRQT